MRKFTNSTSLTDRVRIVVVLAFVVALSSCSGAGESSSAVSDSIPEQVGDAGVGGDVSAGEGQEALVVEVELTEAEKEELRKAEAAALEERKAFDVLVFGCGQDVDYRSCVDLREQLDERAERELITRCDILDQVACGALHHTVVADLQVACVYGDDTDACSSLESVWTLDVDSTFGVDDVVGAASAESLEIDCELGGAVQCAELASR